MQTEGGRGAGREPPDMSAKRVAGALTGCVLVLSSLMAVLTAIGVVIGVMV
ncbi:MAG: hypothetical protein ACRELY_11160 [Polyangiaceae bacterium]